MAEPSGQGCVVASATTSSTPASIGATSAYAAAMYRSKAPGSLSAASTDTQANGRGSAADHSASSADLP